MTEESSLRAPQRLEDTSDVWRGNLLAKFGPPFTSSYFVDASALKTRLPRDSLVPVTTLGAARNDKGDLTQDEF